MPPPNFRSSRVTRIIRRSLKTRSRIICAALKNTLDATTGKAVVFDFQVQLRTGDSLPIEDVTTEWSPDVPPLQTVGTLTIEPQDFDTEDRIKQCEKLVFNPWHGLVEHQPLGGINRLRLGVYAASAKYRS